MRKKIKQILSSSFLRFIIVGLLNTIIGTSVMFLSYNLLHTGYWISSALNYVVGSIFSYFANKYFTFKSQKKSVKEVILFVVNISICYFLAYGLAQPVVEKGFSVMNLGLSESLTDQLAMLFGMGLFVIFNYFGQRLFVFKEKEVNSEKTREQ